MTDEGLAPRRIQPALARQIALDRIDQIYELSKGASGPLGALVIGAADARHDPNELDGNAGYFREYQHGVILKKHGDDEVFLVFGAIYDCWIRHRGQRGFLGLPRSNRRGETTTLSEQTFAGGRIYENATGPQGSFYGYEVHGEILRRYLELGGPSGALGRPRSDEYATLDPSGRSSDFMNGGIFFRDDLGPVELTAPIWQSYLVRGSTESDLGFPVSGNASAGANTQFAVFEHAMLWARGPSTFRLSPELHQFFVAANQGPTGPLGAPRADESIVNGVHEASFEHGTAVWNPARPVRFVSAAYRPATRDVLMRWEGSGSQDDRWQPSVWYGQTSIADATLRGRGSGETALAMRHKGHHIAKIQAAHKNALGMTVGSGWTDVPILIDDPGLPDPPAAQAPAAPPSPPPTTMQASRVRLVNCHAHGRALDVWLRDFSTNQWKHEASLPNHGDANGMCPAPGTVPLEVTVPGGHACLVVAFDQALAGGAPFIYPDGSWNGNAARAWIFVSGNPSGPAVDWAIT